MSSDVALVMQKPSTNISNAGTDHHSVSFVADAYTELLLPDTTAEFRPFNPLVALQPAIAVQNCALFFLPLWLVLAYLSFAHVWTSVVVLLRFLLIVLITEGLCLP